MNVEAACGSHRGRIRRNNEDNFYFDGRILEAETDAEAICTVRKRLRPGEWFAVFDGMGGENFGEVASYAAARAMAGAKRTWKERLRPFEEHVPSLAMALNRAVLDAKAEMMTNRMGTTLVSLSFHGGNAYVCNVGDSRAYCLRDGVLQQLSRDHVESRSRRSGGKPPLTQHLGIDPEEMLIEPHIAKQACRPGDSYLLCSDGLTDMLDDGQIRAIMQRSETAQACADDLIAAALEHGGRDNITVIICKVT